MSMVFRGVKYHLPSTLPDERHTELETLLTSHHAERADSVFDATHIITNSETFEGWQDVNAAVIVSDLWVERSIAAGRMQEASFYSVSKLFSGVIACSADLRQTDEEILSVGITALGGQWRAGLLKDVTHLFAVSDTSAKYITGMSYRNTGIKVLVPDWFDDTVLLGTRNLDTARYEWPDPAVLSQRPVTPNQLKRQQRASMSPQKKALYTTATLDEDDFTSKALGGRRIGKNVWDGRRILLSATLELTGARRKIVENAIVQARGVLVKYDGDGSQEEELSLLDKSDVLVTRYRTGSVFYRAWRTGKTIGTLSWLLHAHATGVMSSPMDQLLHFPVPLGKVEGFDTHIVSVTNYTGETRDYLKKLITLMGGDFTPSLSMTNTALVAAGKSGSKTSKAAEWSIPVVNHTWLEDCFLRWQSLTPALEKYVSHPTGVVFSDLLGERGFGTGIKEIVDAEVAAMKEEQQDTDVHTDAGPHHDSQASADESEVVGGLTMDVDVDMDVDMDTDRDFGGPADDFLEDRDDGMSFEGLEDHDDEPMPSEDEPPRRPAAPSTPKSQSPVKPKSTASTKPKSAVKKIRALSPSSSGSPEPAPAKKVVRVMSTSKSTPKKKGRDTDSDSEAESQEVPSVSRRASRNLVRRVSTMVKAPRRSPTPESTRSEQLTPRKSPAGPRPLNDSDMDDDDFPPVGTFFTKAPKPKTPVRGGTIKAARLMASASYPPSATKKRNDASPRKVFATPTPPSSPLAPPTPSPKRKGVPTAQISVVVPHARDFLSASAKKAPPGRTQNVSAVASHQRAATTSAPPRSRRSANTATSASSPATSVGTSSVAAAEEVGGGRAKRSAAVTASKRLHSVIMPDVVNFQNEMRRGGWKTRRVSGRTEAEEESEELDAEPRNKRRKVEGGKKGKGRSTSDDEECVLEPPARPKARKSETGLRQGKPIKLMATGLPPDALSDEVLKALAKLGARVTNRATECTHLLVPHLVRTEKFLCALTAAPYILTKEWALDSAKNEELMPEEDYLLQDDAKGKFDVCISKAVALAKNLKGKLFRDHTFYITANVPMIEILRNVILANGGQAVTTVPTLRILEKDPRRHVISCEDDVAIWQQIAVAHPIYTSELILMCALRQQIDWEDFRVPGSVP
ncbi:hypothetical protein K438DRAFT_1865499 [Mycena galopus ATCC 62051]|nr:hypothetical protein K438DRAFT_1865499 [Mycena galopus ATCC 62051]